MTTSKFGNDPTTEALYVLSTAGWFTEDSGNVEAPTGWFAWTEIRENDLDELADAFEDEFAEIEGLDLSSLVRGWILYEDSQGFVDAVGYELTPWAGLGVPSLKDSSARKAFAELLDEYSIWDNEFENETDTPVDYVEVQTP